MIAILAALLAFLGFGGVATSDVGTGSSTGTTLVAAPLERASLTWSGGFTGQPARTVVVSDEAGLAELAGLVPDPLPAPPSGETGCADCFEYVLVLELGGQERTYAFDDANQPESLAPLVGALRARDGA